MLKSVYQKTEAGRQAWKARSIELAPRARAAFILFDGVRTLSEVLTTTSGLGVTDEDIKDMLARGFLVELDMPPVAALATGKKPVPAPAQGFPVVAAVAETAPSASPPAPSTLTDSQERYKLAYPIAARLTSSLGLRGFRLNLAVEAAGNLEQLRAVAPRIRESVGAEKCRELDQVLWGTDTFIA